MGLTSRSSQTCWGGLSGYRLRCRAPSMKSQCLILTIFSILTQLAAAALIVDKGDVCGGVITPVEKRKSHALRETQKNAIEASNSSDGLWRVRADRIDHRHGPSGDVDGSLSPRSAAGLQQIGTRSRLSGRNRGRNAVAQWGHVPCEAECESDRGGCCAA